MSSDSKSLDILGVKPICDAVGTIAKGSTDGIGAFLSRICLPAAEEFGYLLRDKVAGLRAHSEWRRSQAEDILAKTAQKVSERGDAGNCKATPRMVRYALEEGSWSSEDELHEAWSGLLASSCSNSPNDNNLGFMRLLSSLTAYQVRLLNDFLDRSDLGISKNGYIHSAPFFIQSSQILDIAQCASEDLHVLDFQIDGMRELGLMHDGTGLQMDEDYASIWLTPYAISFLVRCRGWVDRPADYFSDFVPQEMVEAMVTEFMMCNNRKTKIDDPIFKSLIK
ncbi:hypothetical protein [Sphingobium yanoikuyae]|uniref:Abi-alpha family protein n=1 Tax=Sphingobium yanoikuyae TaxID=13690 RepID=UPI000A7D1559|nr:hypothetical protein [Sphingobium yanoikuyae]